MNQTNKDTFQIEEDILNIITELYERIDKFNRSDEKNKLSNFVESYIKRVSIIGLHMGKSKFNALRDSCVIFHDVIVSLDHAEIDNEQLEQFEIWPALILAYISNPDDKDNIELLVALLENPIWSYKETANSIQELREEFYSSMTLPSHDSLIIDEEVKTKTDEEPVVEHTGAFDGELFESIQEEVIESMTGLLSDLMSTDKDDDFGLGHAFSLCADRIELLGMSIATAGLMGLMDVCTIFQTGLRKLAKREKHLADDEQLIIEEWTSYFIAYLSSPTDIEIVDQLVNYLNNMPWSDSISEDELLTLRFMLIPEDIELTIPEQSEDSPTYEITDSSNVTLVTENNELVYDMDDTEGLDEISISEDSSFLGEELIQLIRDEFELEKSSLDDAIKEINPTTILSHTQIEHLSIFKQILERFSLATESIGLLGINKLLNHAVNNLKTIIGNELGHQLSEEIIDSLKLFSERSLNYLNDMGNKAYISALVSPFYVSSWPLNIEQEQTVLEREMLSPKLIIEDDIEIRATHAINEDISLKLPDDVNLQLLNTLLQELPLQTEEFTQAITCIVDGSANLKDVEKAQRIAHTLKGAANTVGIVGIATLTHHIEDIFTIFTSKKRLPGKNIADTLMNAADVLEMMSESLLGKGDAPEQAQDVLQNILDLANSIDKNGIPEDDVKIQSTQTINKRETADKEDTSHLNDIPVDNMLRVPASLMDELLRLAGESIILGGQLQERLRKATEQTHLVHEQNILYQQLVFDLEQIVDVQGLSTKKTNIKQDDVFDSLELEQYNELHTVTHRLVEAATDSRELTHNIEDELNALENLLVDQSRLHKENQNIVMQTRMVPVQNIVPRLQRSIRQTSKTTGKKVILNVKGSETLMDSDVLDEIIAPLMHILRNAIDHGIEAETFRTTLRKPQTGQIDLSFSREGDHIIIKCRDDGAGLNYNKIKITAISRGLITSEQKLNNDELTRLIWLPGFTTCDTTTQVSGRGIGMDVVYNQISAMKGVINITSEQDKGCTIEIKLPVTLISIHAILIKLRKQTVAVSNRGIEKILCPGDGVLKRDNKSYTYNLNDQSYTAYDIETLLHQPRDQRNDDREERTIFLVKDETGHEYAITVENVIANQDLIVKQLGTFIPDILGIEGATILGDGSIAPVLDLPGLIRTVSKEDYNPLIEKCLKESNIVSDNLTALIVDDSLSARRSLAEFIKDVGYDIRMARDGIEAIEVIETKKPDIILVDLEMPRMNGLELTSHLRSKEGTENIPIIMITSRSTEKHREMADSAGVNSYLTKPFSEDELLEHIQSLLLAVN